MNCVTFRALALLLLLAAEISAAKPRATLYERLGGADGVAAISNALIDRVAADPKLNQSFKDSDLGRIKRLLAEQLCDLSGGGCHYGGDSMQQVHAGHHISQAEFYGMVADLRMILKNRQVSQGAMNELLRLLAPMKRDIVETAGAARR